MILVHDGFGHEMVANGDVAAQETSSTATAVFEMLEGLSRDTIAIQ